MRRLLRVLLPVIVLLPIIAIATPASATPPNPRWCTGEYSLTLGTSMGVPGTAPSGGAGFTLQSGGLLLGSGICSGLTFGNYRIDGGLFGWCGLATGYGWRADGKYVDIVWSGTTLEIAGVAVGALHMTTLDGSCGPGTPFRFVGVLSDTAEACAGAGTVQVSSSPNGGTTSFSIGLSIVGSFLACPVSALYGQAGFYASGLITGWCESATGSGTTSMGQDFTISWTDDLLVLEGQAIGAIHVNPDPFTWGCRWFLARGAVALVR